MLCYQIVINQLKSTQLEAVLSASSFYKKIRARATSHIEEEIFQYNALAGVSARCGYVGKRNIINQ